MDFIRNPELEGELEARLRDKYLGAKPYPHLTELLYCLTRSWFDRWDPLPPTSKELLYFAVGFGLESVLLDGAEVSRPANAEEVLMLPGGAASYRMDGVWLTPDYVDLEGVGVDLKSTRMYMGPDGLPKRGWPETWLKQFMAYARLMGQTDYSVAVVYLIQAEMAAGTFRFSEDEVQRNWNEVMGRKMASAYFHAKAEAKTQEGIAPGLELAEEAAPEPHAWSVDWECKNCRYRTRCERIRTSGGA